VIIVNLWTITWFELRRLARTRTVILNQFLLPLLLIFIIGSALSSLYSTTEKPHVDPISIMMINHSDSGDLDKLGWNQFMASPDVKRQLHIVQADNKDEAIAQLKEQKIDLVIIIPRHFAQSVKSGDTAEWEIIKGKDSAKNEVGMLLINSYLKQLNLDLVSGGNRFVEPSSTDQENNSSYVQMKSISDTGIKYSSFQIYACSMLIMFLLYSGITMSISLQSEQKNKTLARLKGMPLSSFTIFMGKILGNSVMAMIQATVIVLGTHWLYGVNWGGRTLYLIVICFLIIIISMLMATVITLLVKSSASTSIIIQSIIVVMTFVSGGFRPINDEFISKLGEYTVNYHASQGIMNMMLTGDMTKVLHHISILGIYSAVILLISVIVYRKVGYNE
jgi:ABC-2 type transport system permease protein